MISDKFTLLLEDLSKYLSLTLKPDAHHSCLLVIKNKVKVQLELDPTQNFLIIGSILAELPPGKFRENTLFAALKANAKPYPRLGNFAYSNKKNALVLFEKIEMDVFSIENILSMLIPFIKKAIHWKDALDNGHHAPMHEEDYLKQASAKEFFGG